MTSNQSGQDRHSASIDLENCIRMFNGDRDVVLALVGNLLNLYEKQKRIIIEALADHDPEKLRREAHSIKGGAAVLSAEPLMEAASVLEEIGKSGEFAGAEEAFTRLEKEAALLADCYIKFIQ